MPPREPPTTIDRRRDSDMQMGMLTEAVNTLKEGLKDSHVSLNDIRTEQGKQTAILAGIAQQLKSGSDKMADLNKIQNDHVNRIGDLEKSKARALGAASASGAIMGFIAAFFGKH